MSAGNSRETDVLLPDDPRPPWTLGGLLVVEKAFFAIIGVMPVGNAGKQDVRTAGCSAERRQSPKKVLQ